MDPTTTPTPTPNAIPESVITTLAQVRESGATNMLDHKAVVYYANEFGCPPEAIIWLHEADGKAYMAALNEMGARRAK